MTLLIRNFTKQRIEARRLTEVEAAVLAEEGVKSQAEVSLVFTGDQRIRRLNRTYRGVDRVTDVLSFEGGNDDDFVDPSDGVEYLGEIFICYPRAVRQAREKGHTVAQEIDILLVHGLFHLFGYDHIKDDDYETMHRKEIKVLKRLHKRI